MRRWSLLFQGRRPTRFQLNNRKAPGRTWLKLVVSRSWSGLLCSPHGVGWARGVLSLPNHRGIDEGFRSPQAAGCMFCLAFNTVSLLPRLHTWSRSGLFCSPHGAGARSGLSWLSFTVCVGFPAKFLFCRPSINRSSSAISSGLLCLPPLWISSSLCINSAKFSMTSSKAAAARGPISFQRCSNITCQFGWSVGHPTYMKSLVRANV